MISKGTIFTCENGHEVCELATDIDFDTFVKPGNFCNFREISPPTENEYVGDHPCKCGANWVRVMGQYAPWIEFHVKGKGWRETKDKSK
jgi:hypothetical protein